MFPSDTSLVEEEGADMNRADRDGAGRVGAIESVCRDLNYTSLCLTVAATMAQI